MPKMRFDQKESKSRRLETIRQFLEKKGGDIDPALGKQTRSTFVGRVLLADSENSTGGAMSDEVVARNLDEQKTITTELRRALLRYKELNIDPPLEVDVENCTWDDVFRYMTKAQEEYEEKATKWRGLLHLLFRKTGDMADDTEPVLDLIPEDYGLGILRAGLSIIFILAKNAGSNRIKILEAFEEIPTIIVASQSKRRIYPHSKTLKTLSDRLNLTILISISHLVGYLLPERHAKEVWYYWYKGKITLDAVDSILDGLRRDSNAMMSEVADLLHDRVQEIENLTLRANGNIDQLHSKTDEINDNLKTFMDKLFEDNRQRQLVWEKSMEEGKRTTVAMEAFLEDVLAEKERLSEENKQKDQEISQLRYELYTVDRLWTPPPFFLTPAQFLAAIGMDTRLHQATADIDQVIRLRSTIDSSEQIEAASLFHTNQFREWLQLDRSDELLVDGGFCADRVSARSVLCATLIAGLNKKTPDAVELFFFCGLHSEPSDPLAGPRGLMRSLLCEAVKEGQRRGWLNLHFINDRSYYEGLRIGDLGHMCDAFHHLVNQMGGQTVDTPVYCIIDNISQCEKPEWQVDSMNVINALRNIVNDTRLRPRFKLLLTSPHRTFFIHTELPPNKRLYIQSNLPGDALWSERGLISGHNISAQFQRQRVLAEAKKGPLYGDDMGWTAEDYN